MCGADSYGDRAHMITEIAEQDKLGRRLVRGHPMIEAEVVYAARHEYCETAEDFIARRTRLAFLDVDATRHALPRVSFISLTSQISGPGSMEGLCPGCCWRIRLHSLFVLSVMLARFLYSFLGFSHHCRAKAFYS